MRQFYYLLALTFGLLLSNIQGARAQNSTERIVFLAGRPSHGYGSHEHLAGCRILADTIERGMQGKIKCEVYQGGWPESDGVLEGVKTIVMYADGGGGHPALQHLPKLGELMDKGVGFVCIHYAVEVPADRGGPEFLKWLGGYFETHWSVNPHWIANFKSLPNHPVTRGVKPFEANDEWYFHMRFQPEMKGVTPILSAVAPEDTMRRPDGPHSGNPAVRKEVAEGIAQHTAWTYERPNGGRSFGFTGGHYHWNWGREDILRLVCNSILWTAKIEVPADGLSLHSPSVERLEQGQDEPIPGNHKRDAIQKEFRISSRPEDAVSQKTTTNAAEGKLLASSKLITPNTNGHSERLTANIKGVKKLFLLVGDGGNGYSCDWADWIEPTLTAPGKQPVDLTTLNWKSAETQWGEVRKGQNAGGGPLSVAGKPYQRGIGTHANSLIEFDLPAGYEQFEVLCGLDNGGTDQPGGPGSSVQFQIFAEAAPRGGNASGSTDQTRSPENALAGLKIHDGVVATLAAAEPTLRSLTCLDVDHRGRVWVCEVVNYRGHNGKRPEGDRILILQDDDGDGVMDSSKVFHQGNDIDSAMGICVLGNRVIVSASPNIWIFTDENGDDVPDRKELLFSKTGQAQHDHSAHSFIFGHDGKLYFNYGNTGKSVHDASGKPVVDAAGNTVVDNGKPYYGGMIFRCNLDGSEFETLAHNFRNNYEVTLDSFGTLWQSDNDDDGNKATRINYVMEYGNYGYLDELTGAGWKEPRTNLEKTIPEQHWHLNDPGVVPTMLITGAGSPCGIMVYEGSLLPEVFRNQVIHCDPGPNSLRAYPVTVDGAGYKASIENIMTAGTDNWFRPVDVCAAPDGSLFAVDWYDPGVGGHQMGDLDRGRLYRVAPANAKYAPPILDVSTAEKAVSALASPNQSIRFMAWRALQGFGKSSKSALEKMSKDSNPRMRARALWALAKIVGDGTAAVTTALSDKDADVRCMGIRLARQLKQSPTSYANAVSRDSSPSVRRELAVALRFDTSEQMPQLWAQLALQYANNDRWYLEALGIGAALRWSDCFVAYEKLCRSESKEPNFDIAWRARCPEALPYLQAALLRSDVDESQVQRVLRSLDYHSKEARQKSLESLLAELQKRSTWNPAVESLVVEAVMRTSDAVERSKQTKVQQALRNQLRSAPRDRKVMLLRSLYVEDRVSQLIELASAESMDNASLAAAEMLIDASQDAWIGQLAKKEDPSAVRLAESVSAAKNATPLLKKLIDDKQYDSPVRVAFAKGLARTPTGAHKLLEMAEAGTLPAEARLAIGSLLRGNKEESIRAKATELFPPPKTKSAAPLPALTELLKRTGDVAKGAEVYKTTGTCAKCHQVGTEGKNVGPNLGEIGSKLAKEAMYVAILDPSAGISHNYESYSALTLDGQVVVGLMISQTDLEVVLRNSEGIDQRLKKVDLEALKKSDKSLMPENLMESMTVDELVNLVAYLQSLKKQ
ncbi:MAG: PVC-type heme-binding CxxCH protein [Pirellulales bacterium]